MNIILNLDQKTVEDLIYMIKGMPSQPVFLADIEVQLETQLAPPVEPIDVPADNSVDIAPAVDSIVPVDTPSVG